MDEFLEWAEARRQADEFGLSVLATFKPDGQPVYVLVDEDATPDDCGRRSFRAKHGRDISGYEEFIQKLSERVPDA
jgi:glucuronate isomerase